jgi:modification methylase
MKALNGEKQMRSDWVLPLCTGPERLKVNGEKAHPTQKPESLLYRVIASSSDPGDIVLDPFFGTGTTGVVAKRLQRRWIGIEREESYIQLARERIEGEDPADFDPAVYSTPDPRRQPRVPFGRLLEEGLLSPGQTLYFRRDENKTARVLADGMVEHDGERGSIHKTARRITGAPGNGWELWLYEDEKGERRPVNELRQLIRKRMADKAED